MNSRAASRAEQVGEDAPRVVGVVEEQQQVTEADQRVRAVAGPAERIGPAVHVTHHMHPHSPTISRSSAPNQATRAAASPEHSRYRPRRSAVTSAKTARRPVARVQHSRPGRHPGHGHPDRHRRRASQPDARRRHHAQARGRATSWADVTARQFGDEVRALAKGLIAAGMQAGDRVGLMSRTTLRVDADRLRDLDRGRGHGPGLRDLVGRAGRVDPRPTPERRAVFAETDAHAATIAERQGRAARPGELWLIDTIGVVTAGRRRRHRRRAQPADGWPRPPTTWPRSSTPRAPPAGPRAAS